MADKNDVASWDATAANNDNIAGVPLGEGATYPSHVNNAIRALMAQIATFTNGLLGKQVHDAPAKGTPVAADEFGFWDSVSGLARKATVTQLQAIFGMAPADKTKLNGIAAGATANSSDAVLLDRANHTGTQAATTITGLGALATKNAAVLTTDVSGILPVTNGGTGASAFPGAPKVTSSAMPVGYSGLMNLSASTTINAGATVAGSSLSAAFFSGASQMNGGGSNQSGTWRNDSGGAVASASDFRGGGQFTRIS